MTPEEKQQLENLKREVAELTTWKQERMRQQLTYPLDKESKDILARDFVRFLKTVYIEVTSGKIFREILVDYGTLAFGSGSSQYSLISVQNPVRQFSADSGTDTLTSASHGFENGQTLTLYNDQPQPDLPGGLDTPGSIFYVVNKTTDTFQLEATLGGGAINITNGGTGNHYAVRF